ncbi:hypothetical protein D9_0087 [Aeromonas phage D9]|nr:hypothetical protein D9_0087 [Aeromonas phage D9]
MFAIKNITVLFTVVISLVGINHLTVNNHMKLHDGVRPVVQYDHANRILDVSNLEVKPNTF